MQDIAILIPAAGTSSRMRGRDKLTEIVSGEPLLRRQAQTAMATGAHVCVTLPDYDHPRAGALAGLPVQLVGVPDADLGMSASLRRGVAMLPRGMKAVVVLPADMPEIDRALPVILVTHRYHQPRAYASFRWAGFDDITMVAPDAGEPFATRA